MRRTFLLTLPIFLAGAVAVAPAQTDRGTVSGTVVNTSSEPVVNAIIKFTLERSPTGFRSTTKSRPPDGTFSDEMPQGWVLVSVFKKESDGVIWAGQERVKVDTNFGATVPEIQLAPQNAQTGAAPRPTRDGSPLSARLDMALSDGAGAPVAGHVLVSRIETGAELAAVAVGVDGYSMVVPARDEYIVIATAPGYESRQLIIRPESDSRIDIELH